MDQLTKRISQLIDQKLRLLLRGDFKVHAGGTWISLSGLLNEAAHALINHEGLPGIATDFLDLSDTPSAYIGQSGKVVSVKATEDGLEFTAGGGGNVSSFTDLDDVPSAYTGQAGKIPAVNSGETALEFIVLLQRMRV